MDEQKSCGQSVAMRSVHFFSPDIFGKRCAATTFSQCQQKRNAIRSGGESNVPSTIATFRFLRNIEKYIADVRGEHARDIKNPSGSTKPTSKTRRKCDNPRFDRLNVRIALYVLSAQASCRRRSPVEDAKEPRRIFGDNLYSLPVGRGLPRN